MMARDPARATALRAVDFGRDLLRLPQQSLFGEPTRHLAADPTGQLLDLSKGGVAWADLLAVSGV